MKSFTTGESGFSHTKSSGSLHTCEVNFVVSCITMKICGVCYDMYILHQNGNLTLCDMAHITFVLHVPLSNFKLPF